MSKQRVAVVADSSISLPREAISCHRLYTVPIELVFEGKVYNDGQDLEPKRFYELLRTAPKLPTTSAPRPASFLEVFRKVATEADAILCLTLSAKISATHDSARAAATLAHAALPGLTIKVLDTQTAAGAEGLVALEASRVAMAGGDLEAVTARAREVMSQVNLIAFLDTLYYLWKGGRVPKVAAWASSILKLKPLLELRPGGEVRLIERPRTKGRAMERLIAIMAERTKGGRLHVNVMHADALEDAKTLAARIKERFDCAEAFVSEFTPVMGAHTGPGLLGLAFYSE